MAYYAMRDNETKAVRLCAALDAACSYRRGDWLKAYRKDGFRGVLNVADWMGYSYAVGGKYDAETVKMYAHILHAFAAERIWCGCARKYLDDMRKGRKYAEQPVELYS